MQTPRERAPLPTPDELRALPPDGGERYNRLVFEKSPYLLQHAANPVDWHPWDEETFEKAKREDKPVFLSIGYSTCHWCHVMEHESFEDEEVAALLNELFVPVKVDREERPDVDHVYMTITQAVTGSGGWPMTVVLTPDRQAFFAGTYFPKQGRMGRPGMMELLPALARTWRDERERVTESAERLTSALAELWSATATTSVEGDPLQRGRDQLAQRFDPEWGGFGRAPKFPTPHDLSLLLRHWKRTGDGESLAMVEKTLTEMRRGGIFDHVGLGLHRYSTDREWLLPHFEKMLYDQALLVVAAVEAFQATRDERPARLAREVAEYVLRDMTSPEGGFYSAEDADSEGEEGLFYVWTPEELKEVLGPEEGDLFVRLYNVEEGGNFRDQATGRRTGRSILHLRDSLEALAAREDTTPAELRTRLEVGRAKLFAARERRVHPLKDDKVLTDWNGLMIAALARSARVLDEPEHAHAATRAADFVLRELKTPAGRLHKRWRDGEAGLPAVLDDHAFLAWGLVELFEATQDPRWLRESLAVADVMLRHFRDEAGGGLFMTADDGERLLPRSKESQDGAIPSGNSVAALALAKLARLTGKSDLEDEANAIVAAHAAQLGQAPAGHAILVQAWDLLRGDGHEVVIAGDPKAKDTRAMVRAFEERFRPNDVLVVRPPDDGDADGDGGTAELVELAPYTATQVAEGGRATAYVCRQHSCQAPTTSVDKMKELLGDAGAAAGSAG